MAISNGVIKKIQLTHDFLFNSNTQLAIALIYQILYYRSESWWNLVKSILICFFWCQVITASFMTIGLHRYFSHNAFKCNRFFQFIIGICGTIANQKGILWWSSIHRKHHKFCDEPEDPHSVKQTSFMYAWIGWTYYEIETDYKFVPIHYQVPELIFLNNCFGLITWSWLYLLYSCLGFHSALIYLNSACMSTLFTLYFNVAFHPAENEKFDPNNKTCTAADIVHDVLALMHGEAYHDDHHKFPQKANRPGWDWPYFYVIRPLELAGIVYNLK